MVRVGDGLRAGNGKTAFLRLSLPMNAVFAMVGWRFGFWGKERELPVWLACFSSGGVGSGGFLCWRRGMDGFFGGWRAIWLGTHGFGGRVLRCWGGVEAAVVAAGSVSGGRTGFAGVACLFRLRWSWFRRLLRWRRRSGRFGGGNGFSSVGSAQESGFAVTGGRFG